MPTFENTDAAFTAGAPFLKLLEPTLLLPLLAGGALGVIAPNRYSAVPHLLGLWFVSGGKKTRCRPPPPPRASQQVLLLLHTTLPPSVARPPLLRALVTS